MFLLIWIQEVKIDLLSLVILIRVFLWTNRLPYYGSSTWKRPSIQTFTLKKKKAFSKNNIGNCIGLSHAYVFCSTYPFVVVWKNRGIGLSHFNLSCKQPRKINIDNVILKYASTQTAIIYYQKRIHFVLNCFWGC